MDPVRIGTYRILQRIGRGGTGRTYLAISDQSTDEAAILVCLKTPHPHFASDPRYLRAFDHEAAIAATVDHPHVVALIGRGVDDNGIHYLVYPFIEGLDLSELVAAVAARNTQLSWSVVATIGLQCALALEATHADQRDSGRHHRRAPILHRDICAANVLVSMNGNSYIADFGFARAAEAIALAPSLSGGGRFLYSAPERLIAGSRYDARADLFSLGVTLFEALTNHRPFSGRSSDEYVQRVFARERPRAEELRAEFLENGPATSLGLRSLVQLVDALIEPKPAHRLASAAALVDALRGIPRPTDSHRLLRDVVRAHRPPWRRSLHTTGEIPDASDTGLWSHTDLRHVAQHALAPCERDAVWVAPEDARRLRARADTLAELDATVPDRTTFEPETSPPGWRDLFAIPATLDGQPVFDPPPTPGRQPPAETQGGALVTSMPQTIPTRPASVGDGESPPGRQAARCART